MGCGASTGSSPYVAPVAAGGTAARGAAKLSGAELLSSVRAYVESPAFAAPLSNWIDENCVTFTEDCMDDASMEPAYRGYHSQYIAFTDALLTAHLMQFGVSLTKFYRKNAVQGPLPHTERLQIDSGQMSGAQDRAGST